MHQQNQYKLLTIPSSLFQYDFSFERTLFILFFMEFSRAKQIVKYEHKYNNKIVNMFQLRQSIDLCFEQKKCQPDASYSKENINSLTPVMKKQPHLKESLTKKIGDDENKQNKLYENLQCEIEDFKTESCLIQENFNNFAEKIINCSPQELIYRDDSITSHEKREKLQTLRNIMQSIFNSNQSLITFQKSKFLQKNGELQKIITDQMEDIQALDQELFSLQQTEEQKISELQRVQGELKRLLKKKADMHEIEIIDQERKEKIKSVRVVREGSKAVKDKKMNKIKLIMKELEDLNKHRAETIKDIQSKYLHNIQPKHLIEIVKDLKEKMNMIYQLRTELPDDDKETQILTSRSSSSNLNKTSTLSYSMSANVSPFETSQNIKPIHKLKSSQPPFTPRSEISTNNIKMSVVIGKYEQIMASIMTVEKMRRAYIQKKKNEYHKKCELLILQKCYLQGVMEIDTSDIETEQLVNILTNSMQKCQDFLRIISIKVKEKSLVLEKIKNIQKTQEIFKHNLSIICEEEQNKNTLFKQIQTVLLSAIKEHDKSKLKDYHKDMEKLKMKRSILEKDLEEFAESTNLQGYRQTKIKIASVQEEMLELQNKAQDMPKRQSSDEQCLKEVKKMIGCSNIIENERLGQRIWSKNMGEMLEKAKKRLLPL